MTLLQHPTATAVPRSGGDRRIAIVLAAGLGTRMRSRVPKLLHTICGRPMLAYVVDAARVATSERPLVVYSPATAGVRDAFGDEVDYALQDEPRGTADAVRAALDVLDADVRDVLVLNGDVPLLDPALLEALAEVREADDAAVALVAVDAVDPAGLGRIVRDEDGAVEGIVELKDASEEERSITEINAGLYAFEVDWLRRRIADVRPSPRTAELYLTDLVRFARADGRVVSALEVDDDGTLLGINDRSQLHAAERDLRFEINTRHMTAGVTIRDIGSAFIDASVELATDVVIEPNTILRGRTVVGEGSRIGPNSEIVDSTIGRDCRVWASVVESSEVEDDVSIGPFSHLRPGSSIGRGAKLGNYAEVKNSRLEAGVQQHHFSYLGDAHLGARTNVGAGTITANYDGQRKLSTTIGERVFLGVDTMLVAPVTIGDDAKTGAGAVVTRDVEPGALVVGVPAKPRPKRDAAGSEAAAPEGGAAGGPSPAGQPASPNEATSPRGDVPAGRGDVPRT